MEGKFVAGYIGTHGMAHALETVLEAAEKLMKNEEGKDIRFILLGQLSCMHFMELWKNEKTKSYDR